MYRYEEKFKSSDDIVIVNNTHLKNRKKALVCISIVFFV